MPCTASTTNHLAVSRGCKSYSLVPTSSPDMCRPAVPYAAVENIKDPLSTFIPLFAKREVFDEGILGVAGLGYQ